MNILLFDTAIGTYNQGDIIIMESCLKAMEPLFNSHYVFRLGTHLQNFGLQHYIGKNSKYSFARNCDYKFILGTNIFSTNLLRSIGQWPITPISKNIYKNVIMMGVGITKPSVPLTKYSQMIYQNILRKDVIHSVRDEKSKHVMETIKGVSVLNTGCPTLWQLDEAACEKIPVGKSKNVVMTLSGQTKYRDIPSDQKLISIVEKQYDKIYFWAQTKEDIPYFNLFEHNKDVSFIYSLQEYKKVLHNACVDYVGTRLHGGIFAMQQGVRSIIIEIDHRAKGFHETNNLVTIPRESIEQVEYKINSTFKTEIHLRNKEIKEWISQFI